LFNIRKLRKRVFRNIRILVFGYCLKYWYPKRAKRALKRLKQAFKIANIQAASSILGATTVIEWIHELFAHFEPIVIREIANARFKISITFNS
jgi:hypothetical protein